MITLPVWLLAFALLCAVVFGGVLGILSFIAFTNRNFTWPR